MNFCDFLDDHGSITGGDDTLGTGIFCKEHEQMVTIDKFSPAVKCHHPICIPIMDYCTSSPGFSYHLSNVSQIFRQGFGGSGKRSRWITIDADCLDTRI